MKQLIILIIFNLFLILSSCNLNPVDGKEVNSLDLEISNIKIYKKERVVWYAKIPAEGLTFEVKGAGKFPEDAFVSGIKDFVYETNVEYHYSESLIPPYYDDPGWLKGEWWSVNYLETISPYIMEVTIDKNDSTEKREIEFKYGYFPTFTVLHLTQEVAKK